MPIQNPDLLSRILTFNTGPTLIVRPSVSMVFYTRANYVAVKAAVADALQIYLRLVPAGAIAGIHEPVIDPDTGREWSPFDAAAHGALLQDLRHTLHEEEDFNFVLSATLDGQAGDYGVAFSGINFDTAQDVEEAESVLRLDFPWNLLDLMPADTIVECFENFARLFPTCSGHAGMSFIHPMTFMPYSGDEIAKLARRFLGFDLSHDFVALEMRNKVLTAHWLNLLDAERLAILGGETYVTGALADCELRPLGSSLVIRSAKLPPIVDMNRSGPDAGRLPEVARLLKVIRFANPLLVGMGDSESGQEWLDRLDELLPRPWDNG